MNLCNLTDSITNLSNSLISSSLSKIVNNDINYSTSIIVRKNSTIKDIDDLDDKTIGMINDSNNIEGYQIPKNIIDDENMSDDNINYYDDFTSLLNDLLNNNIDAAFISSSYTSMFATTSGLENLSDTTKVIYEKTKKEVKDDTKHNKTLTEPFTLLLMGVDSDAESLKKSNSFNGDTLILITFNPKTLNATMLSIPRDSYVPIACWSGKPENKITHAAAYGTDCMMSTIENYFDVKIDYYAKINFKGLVQLVDAMGGIDVDVPKDLCTDNSSRGGEVCIKAGHQHLDGEGALVLSRNRKQLANGDLGRGENQQLVIKAMIDKIKAIKSASQFLKILDTISNNFDSNFTTDQILSFYSIAEDLMNNDLAKNNSDLVNIQQLYLLGSGQMIYDERARMVLWDYIPNESSRKDIIKAMKINLGKLEHEVVKEFSFSIDEEYEKTIIGKGPYNSGSNYKLVPDFTGKTKDQAQKLANQYGIRVTFDGVSGTVTDQSVPTNKRVDKLSGSITLTLSKKTQEVEQKKEETKKEETKEDNKEEKKEDNKEEKKEDNTDKTEENKEDKKD